MNSILIIDDNTQVLESLAMLVGLQIGAGSVLTAKNGAEGIAIIDSLPVALILTDLDMPIMDGFGVISHRNRYCPHVPLFVMSGVLTMDVRERLGTLSVSGWIEKPFHFEQIREIIAYMPHAGTGDDGRKAPPLSLPAGDAMMRV